MATEPVCFKCGGELKHFEPMILKLQGVRLACQICGHPGGPGADRIGGGARSIADGVRATAGRKTANWHA